MTRLTFGVLAAATALTLSVAAQAQQLPAAVVGVVDTDRIVRECTVCVAANTQLQTQVQQLQQRAQALGAPLQTEEQALQTVVNALPQGSQPDAALTQRIQTFQTNQQNAQRELTGRQQQIERNVQFVRQQIGQRLQPAIQQVAQQRGATVVVDRGATLHAAPTLDITAAVLAAVNLNATPLNINAPPPPQQPAQTPPQQQPPQQQRRPQGR
jgi:outer membrane protein